MGWEHDLFALLDDLEQQAEALYDAERGVELADRARSEYASVTLAARLAASVGTTLALEVAGVGRVEGVLDRVASGWVLVSAGAADWIVRTDSLLDVRGASARALPEVAWSAVSRLGIGSALRRLADAGEPCVLHRTDGAQVAGVVRRVGADFVEVVVHGDGPLSLLPLAALAAVCSR